MLSGVRMSQLMFRGEKSGKQRVELWRIHKHSIYYKNLCQTGKNMSSKKNHFRHCLLYEYDKVITASAACLNISKVHAKDAMDDSTCCR